jgi:hypothetical protein
MKFAFRDIEPDFYRATLVEIHKELGLWGEYLRLVFTITEGELMGVKVSGFLKPTTLKYSKCYHWIRNILGYDPPAYFSDRDLIGKDCLIFISRKNDRFYCVTEVSGYDNGCKASRSSNAEL